MPYVDGNYVSFICNLQQSPRLLKLCGGGTTKSNSNELPISVPLSFFRKIFLYSAKNSRIEPVNQQENGSCYKLVSIVIRGLTGLSRGIVYMGLYHCRVSHRLFLQAH